MDSSNLLWKGKVVISVRDEEDTALLPTDEVDEVRGFSNETAVEVVDDDRTGRTELGPVNQIA